MVKKTGVWIVSVLVLLAAVYGAFAMFTNAGKYDTFAQCISESDTKFYGASWCPNCHVQKKMFGSSMKYVPYVECAVAGGKGQTLMCKRDKINGYPTWIFPDGERSAGLLELEEISERSGCSLPE